MLDERDAVGRQDEERFTASGELRLVRCVCWARKHGLMLRTAQDHHDS